MIALWSLSIFGLFCFMEKNRFSATFWGVRGSIPTPTSSSQIREKISKTLERVKPEDLVDATTRQQFIDGLPVELRGCFGGNSSCVEILFGETRLIFDCGTGIRPLGLDLMQKEYGQGKGQAHIFVSHFHWDHIMGIPFFLPFLCAGQSIRIPFGI